MKPSKTQPIVARKKLDDGTVIEKRFSEQAWNALAPIAVNGQIIPKQGWKRGGSVDDPPEAAEEETSEEDPDRLSDEEIEEAILDGKDHKVQVKRDLVPYCESHGINPDQPKDDLVDAIKETLTDE